MNNNFEKTMSDMQEGEIPSIFREENAIYFYEELNRTSVYILQKLLKDIVRDRYEVAHIIVASYGGNPYSIFEFIQSMPIPVYTYINGVCASAAVILFLSGTKRFIAPTAQLLIHSARDNQDEIAWKEGNSRDHYDSLKKANDLMQRQIFEATTKIPSKELETMLEYQERWLTPKECIKYRIADEIGVYLGINSENSIVTYPQIRDEALDLKNDSKTTKTKSTTSTKNKKSNSKKEEDNKSESSPTKKKPTREKSKKDIING